MKYKVISEYRNKKCYYGILIYNNKKVFYKKFDSKNDLKKEINGYNLVKKYYDVPKIILNYNNIIFYEFVDSLLNKTIYDSFYFKDDVVNYNKIIMPIYNSLDSIKLVDEKKLCNYKFFADRVNMVCDYLNNNNFRSHKIILHTLIKKIKETKKLYSFISQGDPTDTNISIDGIYTDFENSGYNSIVGEISIFVVSILTHGSYFYPKYNKKVYTIRPNYSFFISITDKNIKLLDLYLNMIKNKLNSVVLEQINEYLKYYLCFRLITPLNVNVMEYKDVKMLITLIDIFMEINSIDDLIEIIRRWDVCFIKNILEL